jgi:L-asparaginase
MTKKDKKIVVLGTGGTIAGRANSAADNLGYTAAQIGVTELLQSLPPGSALAAGVALEAEQVAQIDSKDMSFAIWLQLAQRVWQHLQRDEVQGIVITHGTDTLEETAYFLHALLQPAKPVVLTCAMRPATSSEADGPQNLADALTVAQTPQACGVLVVCAGVLHGALDVQKVHTYQLDAFSSGDAGPRGHVRAGRLDLIRNWPLAGMKSAGAAINMIVKQTVWPRVEVVTSYPGASGVTVDALVQSGVQGLVVAGTGNGTVHADLLAALLRAEQAGVRVWRSTRCVLGRVLPHSGDSLAATRLTPVKARVALMLALMGVNDDAGQGVTPSTASSSPS